MNLMLHWTDINYFQMNKIKIIAFAFSLCASCIFAGEASKIVSESAKKANAEDSIKYVESQLKSVTQPAEKRSLYIFLGTIQEQLGNFDLARENYVAAAGIAAGDAEGMPKKSNEQLVLDAVRCALSLGDTSLADSYLNSAVRNSQSQEIQAYIILYSQWSALCKADTTGQVDEAVVMLEAYSQRPSLSAVHPQLLLTLWYVTGKEKWAEKLRKDFPLSVETAVINGKAQLLPSPFWFFVPRSGVALPEIADEDVFQPDSKDILSAGNTSVSSDSAGSETTASVSSETTAASSGEKSGAASETSEKPKYLQLGLFREKDNAQALVNRLKKRGFTARIASETRPSGNVYYIVAVDDSSEKTMAELRSAGFDCYPVF